MTSDRELLRRYAREDDEAAFAVVVRRQADLVYSVALRMARDAQLAQDVTQTVFIKLAGRAGFLCHYDTVVGWLHTTTRHCTIDAIRAEARRRAREEEATIMHHTAPAPEANWEAIGPLLDEAVGSLGEDDRKAVLLRYFKNLSHQEIGTELGLSENSANKRVERALEKLRGYFARRGLTATASILAAAISTNSVQAAPAGLVAEVARTSVAGVGSGIVGETFVLSLLMSIKTKIILAAVLALVVAATITVRLENSNETAPDALNAVKLSAPVAVRPQEWASVPAPTTAAAMTNQAAVPVPDVSAETIPGPKTDLKVAIAAGKHFLETDDYVGFFKTLMPPGVLEREGKGATVEEFAAQIRASTSSKAKMTRMLEALNLLDSATPQTTENGTKIRYVFDPPLANGLNAVTFINKDGIWYLNGM